jgi:sugar phosphate isomerase/epimerase
MFQVSLHPCIVGWRLAWPALAELAGATGYCGAVIARDQALAAKAHGTVRATAMQLPVEVRKDEDTFRLMLPGLQEACRRASEAGCRVATLGVPPSSEQPRDAQAKIYRQRLKRCCGVLEEYSIRLALDCITPLHMRRAHRYEFILRNDEMLEFGLSVSPQCGLVVDAWHWHHAGSDPEWIRAIPSGRILDVHIADSPAATPEAIRDSERLLPGEGVVDFKLFFDLLRQKNYNSPHTVEVFGRGLAEMAPADAARLAFRAASKTLKESGPAAAAPIEKATAPNSAEV